MAAGAVGIALLGFAGGFAAHQPKDKIVKVPGPTPPPVTVTVTVPVPALNSGLAAIADPTGAGAGAVKAFSLQFTGPVTEYLDLLHPAQQAQFDRKVYLKCYANLKSAPAPKLTVINVGDVPLNISGIPEKAAKSVTLVVDDSVIRRLFAVKVDGTWRWVMGPPEVATYKAKRCK